MQLAFNARRFSGVIKSQSLLNSSSRIFQSSDVPQSSQGCRDYSVASSLSPSVSGNTYQDIMTMVQQHSEYLTMSRLNFSSEAYNVEGSPTDAAKELYDKMLHSIMSKRSMPPNAWLWSLIENCKTRDDIKLLFDILQHLRRFRLSNLRIHSDFNFNLCQEITKACVRVGALDFAKRALWKHNIYGLTPTIASAHHLLLYAKEHNDSKFMVEIMKLMKTNDLPLQPGTADIVCSICYNTDNWELICKYSKRFVKAGVKLRQTSFDIWMNFAAKIGDTDSIWKIEKWRSDSMKHCSLVSAFSCAKGFLLERKPEEAAATIEALNQNLPDKKKPDIMVELQKLVSEWPLEVIKHQKEDKKKALASSFRSDIPAMTNALVKMGVKANVDLEFLTKEEALVC